MARTSLAMNCRGGRHASSIGSSWEWYGLSSSALEGRSFSAASSPSPDMTSITMPHEIREMMSSMDESIRRAGDLIVGQCEYTPHNSCPKRIKGFPGGRLIATQLPPANPTRGFYQIVELFYMLAALLVVLERATRLELATPRLGS